MSSLTTIAGIAKPGTKSVKSTVPEGIVVFLGVRPGDTLEWQMDIVNGERVAILKKAKYLEVEADKIAGKYTKVKK